MEASRQPLPSILRAGAIALCLLAGPACAQVPSYVSTNGQVSIPLLFADGNTPVYDVQLQQLNGGKTFNFISAATTPPASQTVAIGGTITLGMDQTVYLNGSNIAVRLVAVTEDSRCPSDGVCVTSGQASVALSIWENNKHTRDIALGTTSGSTTQNVGNLRLTLRELIPAPTTTSTLTSADYSVKLDLANQ